ncbi:MAG TPA: hypothetical protein VJX67_17025 [Blastocatellia bacterium]|nr:hypothetical protein [Blastocatellia bacterium]
MSVKKWPGVFGESEAREFERRLNEINEEVRREYEPMGRFGIAIVRAATNCRDRTKDLIEAASDLKRVELEFYLFSEFLYFFIHLGMRAAVWGLTEEKIQKVQDYIGPLLASTAVESYCGHWQREIREGMIGEFFDNLNNAEQEYSACTNQSTKTDVVDKVIELFMRLGENASEIVDCGNINPATITIVRTVAIDEWKRMDLEKMVEDIKRVN